MAKSVRMEQRRGGLKSRARKLMAVCMGTLQRNLQRDLGGATQTGPEFNGQIATCTLSATGGGRGSAEKVTALTLSKDNLTVTLKCSGTDYVAIPQEMTKVCSATVQEPSVKSCKTDTQGTGNGKQITLESLLGSNRSIEWKNTSQATEEKQTNGKERTLELQETDLPFSDKAFFVGCDKNNDRKVSLLPSAECKVDVNVKARPSSVTDNNVVICAYGKDSNPEPLKVEMTTEKNTLTIQCGSEGSLNPESYATQYCDPEGEVDSCEEKKFEGILPMFSTSWWSKGADSNSATLTIPQTDFPESEQRFRVGCVYKEANSEATKPALKGGGKRESETARTTLSCNVIVRSGSPVSPLGQMAATIAGAAALVGLLAGSFEARS
uniref:SRS domain-containing protein n=1 Tax=Neospora caninum (strain Liverpool) TaxID=572307 RepID=A0A0F7ULK7_NEOCL|nr:TPA: SRS domain-containing protein [Neospora caninum Liverpool]